MQLNASNQQDFLSGGGEMGNLIRSIDWSKTPLGPPSRWPQSLRTALGIMLNSHFPMSIVWGPSFIQFYNDAYRPVLGATKHPTAMGNTMRNNFPEIWHIFEPMYRQVLQGEPVGYTNYPVALDRYGYTEETYFDFSYSPIRDESGKVGGVLATSSETTERYISERRLHTLRDMAGRAFQAQSMRMAHSSILLTLQENDCDIPFALYYTPNGNTASLSGVVRINAQHTIAPAEIELTTANDSIWPIAQVINTGKPVLVTGLSKRFPDLPGGNWPEPADAAWVAPLTRPDKKQPFGVLVLGVSPRKAFDEDYRAFYELFSDHATAAMTNAFAYESEKEQEAALTAMREENNRKMLEDRQRFYSLLMQAPVAILILRGPQYIVELVNEAYVNIINIKVEDLAGKPILEVLPELKGQGYEELIDRVMQTGEPFTGNSLPINLVRNDKTETAWFNFVYQPLHEPDGHISGVMMLGHEVTDMVLAQKSIEQSNAWFRRVADTIPVMIWMTAPDGRCIYLNQKWYEYSGQTPRTALGTGWTSAVHPDDVEDMETRFYEANRKQQAFFLEYRLRGADGIYRWILDSGSPIFDEQGNFEGFIGSVIDIDQRKLSENAVRESETRFRQLADSMPQIVWTANPDGYVDYFNKQWYVLIGDEHEYGDNSFIKHVHPQDRSRCLATWYSSVRTGEHYEIEYRFRVKQPVEEYRWFLVRALPIYDNIGQIIKWYGTCTDIDDVKHIEQTLRESEERFRVVADSAPVMVWMADPNKECVFFNKGWLEFTGRTMQQETGFGWVEGIHPDDRQVCIRNFTEAFVKHQSFELEFQLRRYDGEYRWVMNHGVPRYSYDGIFLGFIGSCVDIHERKTIRHELEIRVAERTAELSGKNEELRRSEERYVRMTNEVEDYAIILLSREGFIENWNKGAEKTKGYTSDEIIGKHFRVFYTQEDQQNHVPEALIAEAEQKGKASFEGWRLRKDGSTFWAYAVITALHDDKNEIIGFSKVTRDLTERKLAEDKLKMYAEQLELKNRELERSNSELSSFSYVASHDLQEPLRKIQSFGNLIQNKDAANLSDTSRDYFDRMVKAAIRMQNLIDSLLEFSRTTTGKKNFEEADLNTLLDDVKKELADRLEEKKAVIQASALPTLTVIPFQFRQLLFNLINNSLKYSREEPPVIQVTAEFILAKNMKEIAAQPDQDYYKFSVIDNGIGFEQEYAEKIFELFQRLHGRNEYSGSGIGLAICKKIVENHHGFIRAESEPGKGAAFYFFIPVK